MQIDTTANCFGLSSEQDRFSRALFLPLAGSREYAELPAGWLAVEKINSLDGPLMCKQLTKSEYHTIFLDVDCPEDDQSTP